MFDSTRRGFFSLVGIATVEKTDEDTGAPEVLDWKGGRYFSEAYLKRAERNVRRANEKQAEESAGYVRLSGEQNRITAWLRNNRADVLREGRFPDWAEAVLFLLKRAQRKDLGQGGEDA